MKKLLTNIKQITFQLRQAHFRGSQEKKKFYKNVSLSKSDNGFEINLDRYKLRTPRGHVVVVQSEPLALAVVEEWRCQERIVDKANMHLTSMINMSIDGKDFRDRETLVNGMLEFLRTDTVCFRIDTPMEFVQMQNENWNPIIEQTEKRFDVKISTTTDLTLPSLSDDVKNKFRSYLQSFSDWSLVGFEQVVECLKSFCIGSCVVNKEISIDHAIFLSNLEAMFQQRAWGAVEWKHTIDEAQMKCVLSAALLFVHFNSNSYLVRQKKTPFETLNL